MKMLAMLGVVALVSTTVVVGALSMISATTAAADPCAPASSPAQDTAPDPEVVVPPPVELPTDVRALRAGGGAFAPIQIQAPTAAVPPAPAPCPGSGTTSAANAGSGANATFDPGNIISDQVFYNVSSMTEQQIREFIIEQNTTCSADNMWCLKNLKLTTTDQPADAYCKAYQGGPNQDAAKMLADFSTACGINPQVMLVTLQKEMQGLSKSNVSQSSYNAAWGWHCPDSGPGGTANCDPQYSGFFNQGFGMAKQWSRYRTLIPQGKYNFNVGKHQVLWNVAESGCGGTEVDIKNIATASLYTYTPYQPNAASLAAYPGTGDECSSYGNRNFFRMFQKYFGDTGGGIAPAGAVPAAGPPGAGVTVNGPAVTIPDNQYVVEALRGKTINAPNAAVAAGLAAGFATLGLPYVWGGGTNNGPPDEGCSRGGGSKNSCAGIVGLDCSGLTAYVLSNAGFKIPTNSGGQRSAGTDVPFDQGAPGDIVGFGGHVAIYLGNIDGVMYILEASDVGIPLHVVKLTRTSGRDSILHRYWS